MEVQYSKTVPTYKFNPKYASQLSGLEAVVARSLVQVEPVRCAHEIAFSSSRVAGSWVIGDLLSISPAPTTFPKPPHVLGDHPFVLSFRYRPSTHVAVDSGRRFDRSRLLCRILNLALNPLVQSRAGTVSFAWVPKLEDGGVSPTDSYFSQIGYFHPPLEGYCESTFPDSDRHMPTEPATDYYKYGKITPQEMSLPSNLACLFERILTLSESDLERFKSAIAWFDDGTHLGSSYPSAAFGAYVNAIESLLETSRAKCKECNQPTYRVNKSFIDFLERYAPGPGGESMRAEYGKVYSLRSGLAHRGKRLPRDEFLLASGFEPSEGQLFESIRSGTRVAILNWLTGRPVPVERNSLTIG